ncbi:neurogenic locus notch homolog protein 1-like [Uloborus diversus]|uniref:neurogenic locus notch homolog protein 1-like n=1 Tax=Uloborus diversus TaxID=327109 RepID=UPI00240A003E|nr:neurogenic locus notch homolog protein 1-like [Uloborus diversus]
MELLNCVFLLLCVSVSVLAQETTTHFSTVSDESTTIEPITTTSTSSSSEETDTEPDGDIILTDEPSSTEKHTEVPSTTVTTTTDLITTTEPRMPDVSPCSLRPCKNNGSCSDDENDPYLFTCTCRPGFSGLRCGVQDFCSVSEKGELCRNGQCVYSPDGKSRSCRCYPFMYWNETFQECRDQQPPCFPNPCMNGGTCQKESEDEYRCHCKVGYEGSKCDVKNECGKDDECTNGECSENQDGTLKQCKCNDLFYWNKEKKKCDRDELPCRPNPCQNSGICKHVSSGEYNCSCPEEYSGSNCEIRDYCKEDETCVNGNCSVSDSGSERICVCFSIYYLDEASKTCLKVEKPCSPNPCSNDGICIPLDAKSYKCSCPEEYSGKHCMQRNYCVMDGGNAYCGEANCTNDFKAGTYYCSCADGKYFDYTNHTCESLDLCPLIDCEDNEICSDSKCICREHFKWSNKTGRCESDFCSSSPCPGRGMICKEMGTEGYTCSCKEGFAFNGTHCNNAFCVFPKLNPCEQTCETTEDGYKCGCHNDDFKLNEDNHTCEYNGVSTCVNRTCVNMACVNESGVEKCICPSGYSEEDGECVDDCTSRRLLPGFCPGSCEADEKIGFRCLCEGKYVLSKDGITCTTRKMCENGEYGWSTCAWRQATCVEDWTKPEGYRCDCGKGQVRTSEGICQDICDVEKNEKYCAMMGALCDVSEHNGNVGRVCKCRTFFQSNKEGTACNQPAKHSYLVTLPLDLPTYLAEYRTADQQQTEFDQRKIQKDVTTAMRSMFPWFIQANELVCKMHYSYLQCKFELQFAEDPKEGLRRLQMPELCAERPDSALGKCVLSRSLVLKKSEIKIGVNIKVTNPCEDDLKEDLCGSETTCSSTPDGKSFNCTCKPGFAFRNKIFPFSSTGSSIESCKDINECNDIEACPPNNVCINTIGSFYCSCKLGYRKSLESKEDKCVEICNPSPCDHGDCSVVGDHEYECSCDAGFTGSMCNLEDAHFKQARTRTVIVGAVLGGILLLTLVLAFVVITRLRKQKYHEDSNQAFYNGTEMIERRTVDMGSINNAFQQE